MAFRQFYILKFESQKRAMSTPPQPMVVGGQPTEGNSLQYAQLKQRQLQQVHCQQWQEGAGRHQGSETERAGQVGPKRLEQVKRAEIKEN